MKTLELFTFFLCMSSVLPLPQNFDDIDISKDQPKDEKVTVIFKIFFLVAVVQFIHNLSLKLVSFLTLRVIRISNFSII